MRLSERQIHRASTKSGVSFWWSIIGEFLIGKEHPHSIATRRSSVLKMLAWLTMVTSSLWVASVWMLKVFGLTPPKSVRTVSAWGLAP